MSPLNGPSPDRNSKNWGLIHDNLLGRSLSRKAILHESRILLRNIGVYQYRFHIGSEHPVRCLGSGQNRLFPLIFAQASRSGALT
jgi:hypothetical protein